MLPCCSPYTLKNTQETLCFKKHSTDVLFCTSQLSSRHNPTRVTKPSSRDSCGRLVYLLHLCQLAYLIPLHRIRDAISALWGGSFLFIPIAAPVLGPVLFGGKPTLRMQ